MKLKSCLVYFLPLAFPLRPRDAPSSPSHTPVVPFFTPRTVARIPAPSRASGRGDRLRRAESRWRVWRSASVVCARLTTSMPYRRKWRSCFFSPRVAAHHPLLLTLLPRPPPGIPAPPPPPPRGGLDPRPYLLTLLPSAPRSTPLHPLPLDLFSYFKLVWSDLNCVSAQVLGGSASSWQGPPLERGCQARHRRRPFHHHGLHGIPLDLLLSAFRTRGVPGPTSKLSPRAPAQMGRPETEREGGKKPEGDMRER
jgi:hypothetical protein